MRHGMRYKKGDILLINFPFSDLANSKKRPVLLIRDENELGDFVCFQITSKQKQANILEIKQADLGGMELRLNSFVKYDKCFTLGSSIVDKKLSSVKEVFLGKLKQLFCDESF